MSRTCIQRRAFLLLSPRAGGRSFAAWSAWWALGVFIVAGNVLWAREAVEDPRLRIRVVGDDPAAVRSVLNLARASEGLLRRWLGQAPGGKGRQCVVELAGGASHAGNVLRTGGERLVLPADAPSEEAVAVLAGLWIDRYVAGWRREGDPPVGRTEWLRAAVVYDVLHSPGGAGIRGLPDYTPAFLLYESGRTPDVSALFDAPVPPEAPVLYTVYGVHCHLLVRALLLAGAREDRQSGTAACRALRLIARGRDADAAVRFCIEQSAGASDPEDWLEREMRRLARLGACRVPPDMIVEKVGEMQRLPVVAPRADGSFGCVWMPVDDLVGRLDDYPSGRDAVRALQANLQSVLPHASPIIAEAVLRLMRVLDDVARGRRWWVRHRLRRARRGVEEAVARQKEIEVWLDRMAVVFIPAELRFGQFERSCVLPGVRPSVPESALSAYLDAVESARRRIR